MARMFWLTVGALFARERRPAERRRAGRGRLSRTAGLLLVLLALVGSYLAPRTEALKVQRVQVEGADPGSVPEIRQKSGVIGESFWLVRAGDVEKRLEQLPYVSRANVDRGLFSTSVSIRIEERAAQAVWRNPSGAYLVDDTGLVLQKLVTTPRLPILEVADPRPLRPGEKVDASQIAFALALYDALPVELRPVAEKLKWDQGKGYQLVSSGGWTAVLGDATQSEVKLEVLRRVLARGGVTLVDVSSPTTPYYRKGGR